VLTAVKMLLVFGLLGGTLWWLRRHDRTALLSARKTERPVAVLAQTRVGKSATVAVVRIGLEAYAVGVTEQAVTLLVPEPVELPEPEVDPAELESGGDDAGNGGSSHRPARPQTAAPPATLVAALRSVLGRRNRVQYLDVATDGSVRESSARRPEPMQRR
jgi:flagellar biogenesis protein FliO